MRKLLLSAALLGLVGTAPVHAADYVIDTKGAHAYIHFKVQHLGYSWLGGRFNDFGGEFSYDESNPSAASIVVNIDPASIDSNHAERDKHLRGDDFLNVKKYPEAKFVSTSFEQNGDEKATLTGDFTLHGVTKPLTIDVEHIGAGPDPWGGNRRGFHGTTEFKLADHGIDYDLGPASQTVYLELSVEGVRR